MNNIELLKAIGQIDEKYLNENVQEEKAQVIPKRKVSIIKRLKYVLAPIGIIMIIAITISQRNLMKGKGISDVREREWKVKEVYWDQTTSENTAIVPKWEEMTITQKFHGVKYLNSTYDSSRNTKVSSDKIGEKLGTATLTGYDTYTDQYYNMDATLFKMIDFPKECVIAVQFDGDVDYYIYVNPYYRPATLGDFMKDLNLKDIVSFGTVYYEYSDTDSKGEKQYEKVEFYHVDNETIWEMLFSDLSLENIYKDEAVYTSDYLTQAVSISVDIPLLGVKNISVSLTDKGYLLTNILETGKGFYIGEDTVQEFIDYVIENYEGYKIVYVDKNGNVINENRQTEESMVEEKIMVIENTIDGYDTKAIETNKTMSSENKIEPNIP